MLEELFNKGLLYDCENYKNCHLVSLYSLRAKKYKTFIWYKDRDDREELFNTIKDRILIGYNNWFYDDAVINHLFLNPNITKEELWIFAQTLINGERNPYRYKSNWITYDLLEVIRAGFNTISLKNLAVNFKWHKIEELPIAFDELITDNDLPRLCSYNINDLDITKQALEYCIPVLEMRELLSNNYNLNLHSLSDSGIGKELFNQQYVERVKAKHSNLDKQKIKYSRTHRDSIAFKDVIFPHISFKTPELQSYLEQLKTIVLKEDELDYGEEFQIEDAID